MPPALMIHYRGSYRYDSLETLERVIAVASAQLGDEDLSEHDLVALERFVRQGASLRIDVALPAIAEVRFAAATMFETLARDAIEGAVEATHGARHVDFYPSGGDD